MIITTIFWTVLGAKSGCRHLFYLTPQQAMTASRINWIAQPTAIMSIGFGKVSVAILILRIMGKSSKSLWRMTFLYVAAIGSVLFCALAIILTFAQCKPVQALWDPTLLETGKAKCWKPSTQTDFSLFVGSKRLSAPPPPYFKLATNRLIPLPRLARLDGRSPSSLTYHHNSQAPNAPPQKDPPQQPPRPRHLRRCLRQHQNL